MFTRDEPKYKIQDLYDIFDRPAEKHDALTANIKVDLTANQVVTVRDDTGSVQDWGLDAQGIVSLGDWLGVPTKFLERCFPHEQEFILNSFAGRNFDEVRITVDQDGHLLEAYNPKQLRIEPTAVLDVAAEVLRPDADVIEYSYSPAKGFTFDAVSVDARHEGGDPRIGDITRGGLRFGHDVGLAPWVERYLYRLSCTNGMEIVDHSQKIQARLQSDEDILSELLSFAETASYRLDHDIAEFYALREKRVAHPERTIRRIAKEQGLSDHVASKLEEQVPEYLGEDGSLTMFDIVNIITNLANSDSMVNRPGLRRRLETAGGGVIHDTSTRCNSCASKLS